MTRRTGSTCGRRPKLTPEAVRAVRRWAALGTSISGVARTLGVSRGTLRRYLARAHKREVA